MFDIYIYITYIYIYIFTFTHSKYQIDLNYKHGNMWQHVATNHDPTGQRVLELFSKQFQR